MTVILAVAAALWLLTGRRPKPRRPPVRLVLLVVLVEIRSGRSVLAALQEAASRLPAHAGLTRVARVAAVAGLSNAVAYADDELRPLVAQLARAQRSGASLTVTLHRLIDEDLAEERSGRLGRARSLPTRLMLPITLLMLPGMVILVYGPSLLGLFDDLVAGLP